jgi:hypothetical protein
MKPPYARRFLLVTAFACLALFIALPAHASGMCRQDSDCKTQMPGPSRCTCPSCGQVWPSAVPKVPPPAPAPDADTPEAASSSNRECTRPTCPACASLPVNGEYAICEQGSCIITRDSKERVWVEDGVCNGKQDKLKKASVRVWITHTYNKPGTDKCKLSAVLINKTDLPMAGRKGYKLSELTWKVW